MGKYRILKNPRPPLFKQITTHNKLFLLLLSETLDLCLSIADAVVWKGLGD